MGHWVYAWDVLGELVQQTDPVEAAASQTTTLSYDLLGRLTQRVEPDQTSNWVYDTATTNGVGKLNYTCTGVGCTSTSYSFLRKQSYDSKGRPSTATLSIASSSGTTYHVTYDSLSGKVATVKYPSTFTIANHYQSLYGYLSSISDNATSATLWTITGRNPELQATGQTLGTGDTETQVFAPNTGLIQNITAGPANALANFSYSFDLIDNLTERSDTIEGVDELFCYDTLNRLTNYAVNLSTCNATGSKSVTYNLLGNIKSKSDIATNYTYPSSGSSSVLPHAVSSITGTVGGLVNPHYCYDANGNLTKVYTGGGGCTSTASKSVSWTSANMIAQMVQGSTTVSLTYDEAHQRITQTEPSGTTAYFADPMTGAFAEQAGTTWNDYIAVDGKLVAEHIQPASPATPYMHYFINDHLGSVSVVVDAPNHALERDSYDAWGMRRNANGTDAPACNLVSSTKRGFPNQEMIDALCLVNLNARVYDPVIGRFLSADDVVDDPYDLQHLNRYSYVNNGPLSFTDPTGHAGVSVSPEDLGYGCWTMGPCAANADVQGALEGAKALPWVMADTVTDFVPVVSEAKAIREAWENPDAGNLAMMVVSIVPEGRGGLRVMHHMVAQTARKASERALLQSAAIIVRTDPANLVSLPKDVHNMLHRHSYYEWVRAQLEGATTETEIRERLRGWRRSYRNLRRKQMLIASLPRRSGESTRYRRVQPCQASVLVHTRNLQQETLQVMQTFYWLRPELDLYRWLCPANDEEALKLVSYKREPRSISRWEPPTVSWDEEDVNRPICDFPNFSRSILALSKRAISILEDILVANGELLPLKGISDGYMAYQPMHSTDAFDRKRSTYNVLDRKKGIFYLERPVLVARRLDGVDLFFVPEASGDFFVSKRFKVRVEGAELTGFDFAPIELS